ncbi:MAG: tRNA (adenosine(37)-N6)-dimethylallyltransferase MiaA [Acidobacteriota bacterium]|jgi:tRNA dimethylallyltransferase
MGASPKAPSPEPVGAATADRVIVVVGPTAAGKSELALAIAEWLDGEVVSADAFQVYRGLDVGTAKVGAAARQRVAHHCIDVADPNERYTAGRYAREAAAAIVGIHRRRRIAVVAGGSGFYIRALIDGLAPLPSQDPRWRAALEALAARRGLPTVYAMLERLDPDWARAVGPADRQRLLRALEVTLRCGRPMSVLLEQRGWTGPHYDAQWVGVTMQRELLYARIAARVDAMLAAGWLQEVRDLLAAGYDEQDPGLRAIGYRDLIAHLRGEIGLEEARERIVRATRRYAKRQLTWFRGQSPAHWHELEGDDDEARERMFAGVRRHLQQRLTC